MNEAKKNCSSESGKLEEECISKKVKKLKISFEKLLQDAKFHNIEAANFQPDIYTKSLICNAKVLEIVNKMSHQFQEKFKNCLLQKKLQ